MRKQIIAKVRQAGVVGAGGAGFPTHAKISCTAQIAIANGAECEPLLRVDQQLLEQETVKIVEGLQAVMLCAGSSQGVIALKGKYKGAVAALQQVTAGKPIRLHLLEDFYPAGDEHVLVYEAAGKLVPQGGIPLQAGCVVLNVETLLNVAEALTGRSVTHTYLTISGAVDQPMTLRLPVGTVIREALILAGVNNVQGMTVIEGGPMMGKIVHDLSQPITKTTKGLIVLPEEHPLVVRRTLSMASIARQAKVACVQCRQCTDLCPRFLLGHKIEPHKIMRALKHIQSNEEVIKMALTCSECGVCEQYACIMSLSPRAVNAMLKQDLAQNGIKPNPPPATQQSAIIRNDRQIPIKRLIARLGVTRYDRSAPFANKRTDVRQVTLNLKQHVGVPSQPLVAVGQWVNQGELIAEIAGNSLGANIHASISGFVTEVSDSITIVNPKEVP